MKSNQAQKIIDKFGGIDKMAVATGKHLTSIYRWLSPKGSDGLVPTTAVFEVKAAAEFLGIELTAEDWMP